jgi:hypothetical protein
MSLEKRKRWEEVQQTLYQLSSNVQSHYCRLSRIFEICYEIPVTKHLISERVSKTNGMFEQGTSNLLASNNLYFMRDSGGSSTVVMSIFGRLFLPAPSSSDSNLLPMKFSIRTMSNTDASEFSLLHRSPNMRIGNVNREPPDAKLGVVIDLFRKRRITCIGIAAEIPCAFLSQGSAAIFPGGSRGQAAWVVENPGALGWVTSYDLFFRVRATDPWTPLGRFDGNRDPAAESLAFLSKPRPGGGGAAARARRAACGAGVDARYLKLVPAGWHRRPRFRIAVYGPCWSLSDSDNEGAAAAAAAGPGTVRYILRCPMVGPAGPVSADPTDGPASWCTVCGKVCRCALPPAATGQRCGCRHLCRDHREIPNESSVGPAPCPRPGRRAHDGCARRVAAAAAAAAGGLPPRGRRAGGWGRRADVGGCRTTVQWRKIVEEEEEEEEQEEQEQEQEEEQEEQEDEEEEEEWARDEGGGQGLLLQRRFEGGLTAAWEAEWPTRSPAPSADSSEWSLCSGGSGEGGGWACGWSDCGGDGVRVGGSPCPPVTPPLRSARGATRSPPSPPPLALPPQLRWLAREATNGRGGQEGPASAAEAEVDSEWEWVLSHC